ncbi:MAG: phage terminase large subunit family protein [Candidatus Binatia bacterium]
MGKLKRMRSADRGALDQRRSDWDLMLSLTQAAEQQRRRRFTPVDLAKRSAFVDWASTGNFIADREPIDFTTWRYLRQIYEAVPRDPTGLDMVVMKSAQGGASIMALLWSLWLMLRSRCQLAYFLPTAPLALQFSRDRFIPLARENGQIHRLMGDPAPSSVGSIDEGSAGVRRILQSIAYFTHIGGKVTTEALPLDVLVFDEVQEMLLSDIERAEERVSASPLHAILRISTANFAGSDIHYYYERSDQREFHSRCKCPNGVVLADAWDPRTGPECIDRGNGSTPGVPAGWFYLCPRCRTILDDPQDGEFRPKNPEEARIGFHFPQMLSPRMTASSIMTKWLNRIDTKNFFNRVLGRPYADPDTMPVTEEHLRAAQNPNLRWGPLPARTSDGVFMGIDQMGHENYVVIKAVVEGRLRLLHLEIIQDEDPWARCRTLMRDYRVRYAVAESMPNFNEAHRFARAFDSRVFLASYQEHADEILRWGDRQRDSASTRPSEDAMRTPWTVSLDQFKMMSHSLSMWQDGDIQTPDSRSLFQRIRTRQGVRDVPICAEIFWSHLRHVALVTEEVSGREDEHRRRRAVKKVGIDPHFAFASMLCDVALARAHGTNRILSVEEPRHSESEKPLERSPIMQQIADASPELAHLLESPPTLTCGDCVHFDAQPGRCTERREETKAKFPACDLLIPRPDDDDDEYD